MLGKAAEITHDYEIVASGKEGVDSV
jgi:hypothetical protein